MIRYNKYLIFMAIKSLVLNNKNNKIIYVSKNVIPNFP